MSIKQILGVCYSDTQSGFRLLQFSHMAPAIGGSDDSDCSARLRWPSCSCWSEGCRVWLTGFSSVVGLVCANGLVVAMLICCHGNNMTSQSGLWPHLKMLGVGRQSPFALDFWLMNLVVRTLKNTCKTQRFISRTSWLWKALSEVSPCLLTTS
jgi:hypothetical protein